MEGNRFSILSILKYKVAVLNLMEPKMVDYGLQMCQVFLNRHDLEVLIDQLCLHAGTIMQPDKCRLTKSVYYSRPEFQ